MDTIINRPAVHKDSYKSRALLLMCQVFVTAWHKQHLTSCFNAALAELDLTVTHLWKNEISSSYPFTLAECCSFMMFMFKLCLFLCLKEHLPTQEREEGEARQSRNALANIPTSHDVISDQEMVDKIFGFLPSMIGGQEGQAPLGFEVQICRLVIGHTYPLCKPTDCWNSISGQCCLMNFYAVKESPKWVI